MAFGPESNNPRERRAYAHTLLAKARASRKLADYEGAKNAVTAAGDSRKTVTSGYKGALLTASMADKSTRISLKTAMEIDATVNDPLSTSPLNTVAKNHITVGRRSKDYAAGRQGVWMGRHGITDIATGDVEKLTDMWVTDFNTSKRIDIPGTSEGALDPTAIRTMSDEARLVLARLVRRVAS